jgi:hypothetical protein
MSTSVPPLVRRCSASRCWRKKRAREVAALRSWLADTPGLRQQVLPIGHIGVGDYENKLYVRLWNHGVGPMIVERMRITETKTEKQVSNAIIDAMPKLPNDYAWTNFVEDISGRAIAARDSIMLIQLEGDPSNDGFKEIRNQVRRGTCS